MGCEYLVGTIEVAVRSAARSCAGSSDRCRVGMGWHLYNFDHILGRIRYTHIVQTVAVVDVGIVEPWTIARLPRCCTHHTELSSATATEVSIQVGEKRNINLGTYQVM